MVCFHVAVVAPNGPQRERRKLAWVVMERKSNKQEEIQFNLVAWSCGTSALAPAIVFLLFAPGCDLFAYTYRTCNRKRPTNASCGIDSISLCDSSRSCSWLRLEKGAPWSELMLLPAKSLKVGQTEMTVIIGRVGGAIWCGSSFVTGSTYKTLKSRQFVTFGMIRNLLDFKSLWGEEWKSNCELICEVILIG